MQLQAVSFRTDCVSLVTSSANKKHQRETGQIVSDIDEVLNEDVLALYTWKGVIAQLPP